jgi:hypothetical protein
MLLLFLQFCLCGIVSAVQGAGRKLPYDGIFGDVHHQVVVSNRDPRTSERRLMGELEHARLNPTVLLQLLQKEREGRMKAEIAESRARGENKRLNRLLAKYKVGNLL